MRAKGGGGVFAFIYLMSTTGMTDTCCCFCCCCCLVVSFAGDAIICVFMASTNSNGELEESACCQSAIQCAVEIKNFTSADLSCHVAVSYGEICFAILGGYNEKWTYLINGDCLTELSEALNDAASKEAVATATCHAKANFAEAEIVVEAVPGKDSFKINEVMKVENEHDESVAGVARGASILNFNEMLKFVPCPVSASVAAGSFGILSELREVTTLFLKLDSYCRIKHRDLLTLQPFFLGVQKLLAASGGYMRQFLVDDKGCVVIAIWGVPGTNHPNNCSRALHCGVSLSQFCKTIEHECSIGIATGDAYCGTVGSDTIRQDYVAMGDAVNLAARLMCKANGRVLTDDPTFSELPQAMSAILKKGEALVLKGRSEPLTPYVYSGAVLPQLVEADKDAGILLVDRKIVELLSEETASLATYKDNALWLLSTIDEEELIRIESLSPHHSTRDATPMKKDGLSTKGGSSTPTRDVSMREDSLREDSMRESSARESSVGSARDILADVVSSRNHFADFDPYVRVIMLVGSSGSGKGESVLLFKRLASKHHFRHISFRVNQFDGTIAYSAIHKLFLQLVGPSNFVTTEKQRGVVSHLFAECYPEDELDIAYQKHFPMLKLVLNLEWDYNDKPLGKVSRAYEFMGDNTIQEVITLLFKQVPTTVVVEDVNFCDELSWRELCSILNVKAPVLMLFTASSTRETHGRREGPVRPEVSSSNLNAIAGPSQNLPQVSVRSATRRQSKYSVYGGLSDLDGSFSHDKTPTPQLKAEVLLTKKKHNFSNIRSHVNCVYMKMPKLGEWEVTDILKSVLDINDVPASLTLVVLEISEGSIYWCQSIAKYIKIIGIEKFTKEVNVEENFESEDIFEEDEKSKFAKILERHTVFHLESLSVKLQTVAKYASVIGDEFYVSVLYEILPDKVCTSLHDLVQCVNTLSASGILDLVDDESNIYAFQNDLIRITLREYVLPSDADKIHNNVAKSLEKLFQNDLRIIYSSLSYHYAMSPATERGHAFEYTIKAADQQIGNGNFHAGYLYLEYAASFVKYDTEMAILSQVTETALFDLREQKNSKNIPTTVTDDDIAHFEAMSTKFTAAIASSKFNGAVILHSSSFEYIPRVGSVDSHSSQNNLNLSQPSADTPSRKKVTRSTSARNATFLKMPSYSAKQHALHKRKKSMCSSCSIS